MISVRQIPRGVMRKSRRCPICPASSHSLGAGLKALAGPRAPLASVTTPPSVDAMVCGCPQVATPARRRGKGPVLRNSRANCARAKDFF